MILICQIDLEKCGAYDHNNRVAICCPNIRISNIPNGNFRMSTVSIWFTRPIFQKYLP
jgi:hypothetical protein